MKLLTQKSSKNLLILALIITHVTFFLFAPWVHLHPDEDHAETSGDVYHCHFSFLSSQASNDELDVHHTMEIMHPISSNINLHEGIVSIVDFNISKKIILSHSIFKYDLSQSSIDPDLVPNTTVFRILKHPIIQSQRNNLVMFITDISPPAT